MKIANNIIFIGVLACITACATPESQIVYGPAIKQNGFGYSDRMIEKNTYEIQMRWLPNTSEQNLAFLIERRAKELCPKGVKSIAYANKKDIPIVTDNYYGAGRENAILNIIDPVNTHSNAILHAIAVCR